MRGCPRHTVADRACHGVRCLQTWEPDGAPSSDEQLRMWVEGKSVCPNKGHECCPDFSCCRPALLWPQEKREKFAAADQNTREKMMMGALNAIAKAEGVNLRVTRGVPEDDA